MSDPRCARTGVLSAVGALCLAVTVLATGITVVEGGCDNQDHSFDYLLLVEQWPRAFGESEDFFTLHGLWPSRDGATDAGDYPCECTTEQLNLTLLAPLETQMNKFWPSYEGANSDFWSHEWDKHGTCSGMAQLSFFNTTLGARAAFDATTALAKASITPGKSYTADVFAKAFSAAYGAAPLLGCNTADNSLKEVGWCLDKTATRVMSCTSSVQGVHGEFNDCDTTQPILFPSSGSPPSPSPPGPSPPPGPPGPPATKCVPNKHGPPCSSNADCANVEGCVRCAHSGFCTNVPTSVLDME